jgi:hypothetical protein
VRTVRRAAAGAGAVDDRLAEVTICSPMASNQAIQAAVLACDGA